MILLFIHQFFGELIQCLIDLLYNAIYAVSSVFIQKVFTAESEEISDLNTFLKEQNQKLYDAGIESLLSGIQSQLDAQKED